MRWLVAFFSLFAPVVQPAPVVTVLDDPPPATTSTTAKAGRQPSRTPPSSRPPRANRGARSGYGGTLNWEALKRCESGGNYANKSNPKYRGAYQFSYSTWASVGGTGDPADAPPAEQDMRAQLLYQRSGARPWPHCGRLL